MKWMTHLLALTLGVALTVFYFRSCQPARPAIIASASGKDITPQIPRQYNSRGTVHTEVKVVEAAQDVWLKDYYGNLLSEAEDKLKVARGQIESLKAASVQKSGSVNIPLQPKFVDSGTYTSIMPYKTAEALVPAPLCPDRIFSYRDSSLSLSGIITDDTLQLGYWFKDSIHLVTYWKRKHFLAKKQLYLNGYSTSKNALIMGLQEVKLQKAAPKTWGIGISAGYVFDGNVMRPGIGIGITKTFLRW